MIWKKKLHNFGAFAIRVLLYVRSRSLISMKKQENYDALHYMMCLLMKSKFPIYIFGPLLYFMWCSTSHVGLVTLFGTNFKIWITTSNLEGIG